MVPAYQSTLSIIAPGDLGVVVAISHCGGFNAKARRRRVAREELDWAKRPFSIFGESGSITVAARRWQIPCLGDVPDASLLDCHPN